MPLSEEKHTQTSSHMITDNKPRHAAASVDYAMRQGIQIFYERGLDGNMGEGVWEVKGSVHEDDRQAMMRENKNK